MVNHTMNHNDDTMSEKIRVVFVFGSKKKVKIVATKNKQFIYQKYYSRFFFFLND